MSARTSFVVGRGQRGRITWIRSWITSVMAPRAIAATFAAFCVAGVALAQAPPVTMEDIAGRWTSDKNVTFDISRCGEGWCGVAVTENAACGGTMLRVGLAKRKGFRQVDKRVIFEGQLERAERTAPYGVELVLSRNGENGSLSLLVSGHSGGVFAPMRRTYDYDLLLSRAGDASCRPDSKVS